MDLKSIILDRATSPAVSVPVDASIGVDHVRVRRMTTREMLDLSEEPDREAGLKLVAQSIVDDEDERVFADVDAVREVDWALLQVLMGACQQVNGVVGLRDAAGKG